MHFLNNGGLACSSRHDVHVGRQEQNLFFFHSNSAEKKKMILSTDEAAMC